MQWMTEAQRGNTSAYRLLLDDIGPEVMSFLHARVPTRQEVDDIYQETFLALHRARHTYKPPRPVEPWLFAIADHVVARYMRRQRLRSSREVLLETPPDQASADTAPARRQLAQALDHLPPAQHEALQLLKVDGLPVEVAAARLGPTPGALRVRAHRAYRAFRQLLQH